MKSKKPTTRKLPTFEIRDIEGITFDETELARLKTEDDVIQEVRELFAPRLQTHAANITIGKAAHMKIVKAWHDARRSIQ